MQAPPRPESEERRLATLRALGLLDSLPEERFDAITRTAAALFQTPIALLTLVDEKRQWFKSRVGLQFLETPRDVSFCGHAILGNELFVVEDTWRDKRFDDNPLVVNQPSIRFYAGRPLAAPNGERLGTLCVIDRKPRTLTPAQQALLLELGTWAEAELALIAQRQALNRFLDRLLDEFSESVLIADDDLRVQFANRSALRLLRFLPDEMEGTPIDSLVSEALRTRFHTELDALLRAGGEFRSLEYSGTVKCRDGTELHVALVFFRCQAAGKSVTAVILRPL